MLQILLAESGVFFCFFFWISRPFSTQNFCIFEKAKQSKAKQLIEAKHTMDSPHIVQGNHRSISVSLTVAPLDLETP
jgi:hypothetical protein